MKAVSEAHPQRPIVVAVALSLLVHGFALFGVQGGWLRPAAARTPPPLQVRLMPPPEPVLQVVPPPPPPAARLEEPPPRIAKPAPSPRKTEPKPRPAASPAAAPRPVLLAAAKPDPDAPSVPQPPAAAPVPAVVEAPAPARAEPPPVTAAVTHQEAPAKPRIDLSALRASFGRGLEEAVDSAKSYPRIARERGWQGTVRVRFRFQPGGDVQQIDLVDSSGFPLLDEHAVKIARAAELPRMPGALSGEPFEIDVPIRFRLRS